MARDTVLPPGCLACNMTVARSGALCPSCWGSLRLIERPYCETLGTPFSHDLGKGALSAEAIADPPPFDRARAVALYDDVARRLVQGLKFADRTDLAPWMAAYMQRAGAELLQPNAIIIPVPLHARRLWLRRFNQAAELARHLAHQSGIAYRPELLIRSRATRQQVGLGAAERTKNVSGAFRIPKGRSVELKGAHVVLVDDVYTTGATLKACARAVRRAGAAQIDCLTFARVAPPGA